MEQISPPKEVKILETAESIQERREQVLNRYEDFKQEARAKREKLEDSRRFQYFKRDADELESCIQEKLRAASDESYKDPTNFRYKPPDKLHISQRQVDQLHGVRRVLH